MYGIFAIGKDNSTVFSQDGMVIVYDTENFKAIESFSDGEGLNTDGIKYTVTNNNTKEYSYKLVLYVNEEVITVKSLESGEVLDIDGDCGGFNLQWAWASGYVAGINA